MAKACKNTNFTVHNMNLRKGRKKLQPVTTVSYRQSLLLVNTGQILIWANFRTSSVRKKHT